jgi:hypothetical protein
MTLRRIGKFPRTLKANILQDEVGELERSITRIRRRTGRLHWRYFSQGEISDLELELPQRQWANCWRDHLIYFLLIVVSSLGCAISFLTVWYYAR